MFLTVEFMSPFWLPEFKYMFWPMDYTSVSTSKSQLLNTCSIGSTHSGTTDFVKE